MAPSRTQALDTLPRSRIALVLGAVVVVGAVWAWWAPEERVMGARIRPVYAHVSMTWAGLAFLYGTGMAGLVAVVRPSEGAFRWMRGAWWSGLLVFGAGFAVSLLAARVNWGGVFWAEPRVRSSLGVVAVALVASAVEGGLPMRRWRGLGWTVGAACAFLVLRSAGLVVHPDHPIQDSTPWSIKATFAGMSGLYLVAAALLTVALRPRSAPTGDVTDG